MPGASAVASGCLRLAVKVRPLVGGPLVGGGPRFLTAIVGHAKITGVAYNGRDANPWNAHGIGSHFMPVSLESYGNRLHENVDC